MNQAILIIHSLSTLILGCFFLFFTTTLSAQKYISRTAHVHIKSTNRITDIEADNYQVASVLDSENGNIDFIGLLKSFEFKLGAADQLFNSKMVDVSAKLLIFIKSIFNKLATTRLRLMACYIFGMKKESQVQLVP